MASHPSGDPRRDPGGRPAGPTAEPCYRLRGRLAEGERTFDVGAGATAVGSAGDNAVVLPVRGVSRHHARLTADEGVRVEDLGSRNGTFVNGRPVRESPVSPGDELRFGPVALRLEAIPSGDAELGLEIAAAGLGAAGLSASRDTTRLGGGEAGAAFAWVELLAEVLARLSLPPPGDLEGALAVVARRLDLTGAALAEEGTAASTVLVAGVRQVGELPSGAATAAEREPGGRPGAQPFATSGGTPPRTWTALPLAGGEALVLVLWGDFPGRRESAPLLAALAHVLSRFRPPRLAGLADGGSREGSKLVFPRGYVAGESALMASLYRQLEPLVEGDLPVLVTGETGAGKEPVAHTLHASSRRRRGPFVAVNCAAIPADLLEAEMFGIGKGVATGVAERPGKFVEATGGTLLLDEIGDMPAALQAKLLRALQDKEVQPVGRPARPLDVRVVATTNRDLLAEVEAGRFRRDLYYRIAGYVLEVPPLRRRRDDLPRLIGHFLRAAGEEVGKTVRGVTVKALRALEDYPWPGNVRELEHEVRRLVYLCPDGGAIDSAMLSDHVLEPPAGLADLPAAAGSGSLRLADHVDALERRLIRRALTRARGNQTRAAELLGISRNGLALRLKRLGIEAGGAGDEG